MPYDWRESPMLSLPEEGGGVGGAVGNVLDTLLSVATAPGGMLRNTLALRNPLRGLFNSEERTSGQELLNAWGMPDNELAGFLAEFVTDLAGPGAALKGAGAVGKLAKAGLKAPNYVAGIPGRVKGAFTKAPAAPQLASPAAGMSANEVEDLATAILNQRTQLGLPFGDAITPPGGQMNLPF